MISIKDYSPLSTDTLYYKLNDPDFKGTELFFTDSSEFLYAMLLVKYYDSFNEYKMVYYSRIDGQFNGSSYDYRFDYSNYIDIIHADLLMVGNEDLQYSDIVDTKCDTYLLLNSTDFKEDAGFKNYLRLKTNNDEYIYENDIITNINGYISDKLNFIFVDYSNYISKYGYEDKVHHNSYYLINIYGSKVTYFNIYDKNNDLITEYTTNIEGYKAIFYKMPENAYKIRFNIYDYSTNNTVEKYVTGVCGNQYFFYGTDNIIESVVFSGKRNKIKQLDRQNIYFGKNMRSVNINITDKYLQNTGLGLNEQMLFKLAKTPYLIELGGVYATEWLLDMTNFEGFNTKSLGNRNLELNITKRKSGEIYTGFSNEYFT